MDYDFRSTAIIFAQILMLMKNAIDILGIVLPSLIIILGLIRVFVKKTVGINALTMLFAFLLLLAGFIRYYAFSSSDSKPESGKKLVPISVSHHSEIFNNSLEKVLDSYYSLTQSFADKNEMAIQTNAVLLQTAVDSLQLDEIKVDTLIYQTALQPYENIKAELNAIVNDPSMLEKMGSFNILSNELFALLSTIRYDQSLLYWLECENAFGEGNAGNWIGKDEKTSNPYGQSNCIDTKAKINFMPADSTKVK